LIKQKQNVGRITPFYPKLGRVPIRKSLKMMSMNKMHNGFFVATRK